MPTIRIILGEDACHAYTHENVRDSAKLGDLGGEVKRKHFATGAELAAYIEGLDDGQGYFDYIYETLND